jgi:hypothetical protein
MRALSMPNHDAHAILSYRIIKKFLGPRQTCFGPCMINKILILAVKKKIGECESCLGHVKLDSNLNLNCHASHDLSLSHKSDSAEIQRRSY